MTCTFRDASPGDLDRLAALHVQTFRETHGGGPSVAVRRGQWEQILAKADPADFTVVRRRQTLAC